MNELIKNNIFSFTAEELNVWIKEGHIPKDFLNIDNYPVLDKYPELIKYVYSNQEVLFKCYRLNPEDFDDQIILPSPDEWPNTDKLQVINKKTGKVVNTLEKAIIFELYEGFSIVIRAVEIKQWKKETAAIGELTKEQGKTFQIALSKMASKTNGSLLRTEIKTIIEEIRRTETKEKKRVPGKHRVGRKYIDQKLKKESSFDPLLPATIEKIKSKNSTVTAYGIKLTPSEDKLMNALLKLLYEKSENKDTKSDQYYAGNEESKLVPFGDKILRSAVLRIRPAELIKEYLGKDDYSGKEIEIVNSVLAGLSEKKFLIQSDESRKVETKNGIETRTNRTEGYQALINIDSFFEDMSDKEVTILNSGDKAFRKKREDLKIALHPILTDQISSKYIEYPTDIDKRTEIASGGIRKVTKSIIDLRDYMMREINQDRYNPVINESTLIEQLRLTDLVKQGHSKRAMLRINEAIEANIKLGLILERKKATGKEGQVKYVFKLNPDFE